MPIVLSPQYQDPQVGKIVSNLATAIYGDPEARMKGAYYGSEVDKNRATARKTGIEADRGQVSLDAYRNIHSTLADLYSVHPGEDPVSRQNRIANGLGALVQAGAPTSTADDLAKASGSALSSIYGSTGVATGNDDLIRGGLTLGGHMPNEKFSGTDKQAAVVSNTANAAELTKAKSVAGINQGGETFRAMHAPIKTGAGETVTLAPQDPRRGVNDKEGVITGLPNKATVEGKAGERMLNGENSPTLDTLYSGNVHSAAPVAAGGKPRAVTGKSINDAILAGAHGVQGAVDATNPSKPVLSPDFEAAFDPALVQQARSAASAELARSGDVQKAGAAYVSTLGVKTGDSVQQPGLGQRIWNHLPGTTPVGPSVGPTAPAAAGPIHIQNDADYARVPPGTQYLAPDGQMRVKR